MARFVGLFDLTGKKAVVTGAGGSIGSTVALALAEYGADVALVDVRATSLPPVSAEIERGGRHVLSYAVDVTDRGQVQQMVDGVEAQFGGIDILINHAGLNIRKPALELSEPEWDHVLQVNLKGIFLVAQAVGRVMVRQGYGKIVNTASVSAVRGHRNLSAYAASKGGIQQLTKVLAHEWAEHGVNVNAIGPGYIQTGQTAGFLHNETASRETVSKIPLGRVGQPEDLVGAFLFLVSPASDYVTGHTLFVEGGRLID